MSRRWWIKEMKGGERGMTREDSIERDDTSSFCVKWEWIESFKEGAECDQPRHGYSLYKHWKAWKKRLPLLYPFWMDKQNQSMPDKTNSRCICTQIHATHTLSSNSPQPTQRRLKSKTDGNTWLILTTKPIFDTRHKKSQQRHESTMAVENKNLFTRRFTYTTSIHQKKQTHLYICCEQIEGQKKNKVLSFLGVRMFSNINLQL